MCYDLEFTEEDDALLDERQIKKLSQAVLYGTDWTVETLLAQLTRGNIEMNPRFQRRDAWTTKSKSRFIESVILGLPIPQVVLAEKKRQRGQFIILDGKQRLLSLLQFSGKASEGANAFRLTGLEARPDLNSVDYINLETRTEHKSEFNALLNHTIRTVVIRNWPDLDFLHLVFLRLNTGSVKLSPQELRQAAVPGSFLNFSDDRAISSPALKKLLSRNTPDPRMRDVELLVRHLAIKHFLNDYGGRMKHFLDESCDKFNESWDK